MNFLTLPRHLACVFFRQSPSITQPRPFARLLSSHKLPPRPKINEADLIESFLKGSGPGGQKINKTSCAVQLTHVPTGLQVKCQATRSRVQNRKIARKLLAERVEEIELGKDSRAAIIREREKKKRASIVKKSARKYRALEVDKGGEQSLDEDEDETTEQVNSHDTNESKVITVKMSIDEDGQKGPATTDSNDRINSNQQRSVQSMFEEARKALERIKKDKDI